MSGQVIGVIGGTGNLGAAIAWRLARAGQKVLIGSRKAEAAQEKAAELGHGLVGMANADAAAQADLVIVTVPFSAQEATLADIKPGDYIEIGMLGAYGAAMKTRFNGFGEGQVVDVDDEPMASQYRSDRRDPRAQDNVVSLR